MNPLNGLDTVTARKMDSNTYRLLCAPLRAFAATPMTFRTSVLVLAFSNASLWNSIVVNVPSICCSCFSNLFFLFRAANAAVNQHITLKLNNLGKPWNLFIQCWSSKLQIIHIEWTSMDQQSFDFVWVNMNAYMYQHFVQILRTQDWQGLTYQGLIYLNQWFIVEDEYQIQIIQLHIKSSNYIVFTKISKPGKCKICFLNYTPISKINQ